MDKNNIFNDQVANLIKLSGTELAQKIDDFYQNNNSDAEKRSWQKSLPALLKLIKQAGLDNLYIVIEYQLATAGRIDAILLGQDSIGNNNCLIVELKQWSEENIEYFEDHGFPYIKFTGNQSAFRHPVQQSNEYAELLGKHYSSFIKGDLNLYSCQYLHNFNSEKKEFFRQKLYKNLSLECMFCKGEEDEFCKFLNSIFVSGVDNSKVRDLFLNSEYMITELDLETITEVTKNPENIPLWHDQSRIMDYLRFYITRQAEGSLKNNERHMALIYGVAGTGKTILAFRILAEYYKITGKTNCAYVLPRSRTIKQVLDGLSKDKQGIQAQFLSHINSTNLDILVVDEAHRISSETEFKKITSLAPIVFILQDDKQIVRADELGTEDYFKKLAKNNSYKFTPFKLNYQKRSGFNTYVNNIDNLLYNAHNIIDNKKLGIELKICDSLQNMEELIHNWYSLSKSVKYYAPYCWEWISKTKQGYDIVINDGNYQFKKQWNPIDNQYSWYLDSIDQVGCIYTAQGLGFDYVGLIWWDDLVWRNDHWEYNIEKVTKYDYSLRKTIKKPEDKELLRNIYRVLLTRAKKGICIWFKDSETREYFKKIMNYDNL